jgi:DNA mismatch repair protein MutS
MIQTLSPSEVLYPKGKQKEFLQLFGSKLYAYKLDDWIYSYDNAQTLLLKLFETNSLKGFGIEEERFSVIAAGAAIQYLRDTEHNNLSHISKITKLTDEQERLARRFTIRNLRIDLFSACKAEKLYWMYWTNTTSPMGARMLKRWTVMPLLDIQKINERLNAVEYFVNNTL